MGLEIVLLVLASAALHPVWNLIIKKNADPQFAFLVLTITMCLCALAHGIVANVNFSAILTVLPLVALSICGQVVYGTCLTATLKRGDLSAYYPIVRASPVFVVIVSAVLLGKSYAAIVLLGIAMAVAGSFILLYRRGTHFLDDPRTLGLALLAMSGTGVYSLADSRIMEAIEPQALLTAVEAVLVPLYAAIWFWRRSSTGLEPIRLRGKTVIYLVLPGILAYTSYYLILTAYQLGGEVASVTSVRQASIPISVALGGLFLREGAIARRMFAAGLLALGIVVIALNG